MTEAAAANGPESPTLAPAVPASSGTASLFVIAATMLLAAGLGSFTEELLQDTLKSILLSIGTLFAGVLFFWERRQSAQAWVWHDALALPLLLMLYALGSMAWSHAYLAGAEALRWAVLSLLMWLGLQTFTRERLPLLLAGIHLGAVIASLWTGLQFWFDFGLFPQGPNPASTFVNRNFFAEFVLTSLPFSALLLARAQRTRHVLVLALSNAWCVLALLMTGTRSATVSLLLLAVLVPALLWRLRAQLELATWTPAQRRGVLAIFVLTIGGLGLVGSGNPKINAEHGPGQHVSALERSFQRTSKVALPSEYTQGSFSVRILMWQSTARMVLAHPWVGVGAGAWEVELPLYQRQGTQLETDYYAHNEILQVLAEYGLVGWVFLLGLSLYLALAAWRTLRPDTAQARAEAPMRAMALASLLGLMLVSCAGFPWRLATTGAMLALGLGILAASDARLGTPGWFRVRHFMCTRWCNRMGLAKMLLGLALAVYVSYLAVQCERRIVRAVSIALTISSSGVSPDHPAWAEARKQMLELLREGVAINPHYRKITPMAADELARWGDWKNAIWVWESVVASRPHVAAIHANIARGYLHLNQMDKARQAYERARELQPMAPAVRSLEMVYRARTGDETGAMQLARSLFADKLLDLDVIRSAYELGLKRQDWDLSLQAITLLRENWPDYAMDSWFKQADIYQKQNAPDRDALLLKAYREAVASVPQPYQDKVRQRVPLEYRQRL